MRHVPAVPSAQDPTPLFEVFRGNFASEALVVALESLKLFELLAPGPRTFDQLQRDLALQRRPLRVLLSVLQAIGTLTATPDNAFELSPSAREHLVRSSPWFIGDYFSRAAAAEGAKELLQRLQKNRPRGSEPEEQGVGFLFRDGLKSAMEEENSARQFTLMLSGRAKNVAPSLAQQAPLPNARHLVDIGGGSGIYSVAYLRQHPTLQATVFDRPEVLKLAGEFAAEAGVADRLHLVPGDMFRDPIPQGDVLLFSNILHDWDEPEAAALVQRAGESARPGDQVLVHDVFLNDSLDGPLPAALYSLHLFMVTEGRLYSAAEVTRWLRQAGFSPEFLRPTRIHCSALGARKN